MRFSSIIWRVAESQSIKPLAKRPSVPKSRTDGASEILALTAALGGMAFILLCDKLVGTAYFGKISAAVKLSLLPLFFTAKLCHCVRATSAPLSEITVVIPKNFDRQYSVVQPSVN